MPTRPKPGKPIRKRMWAVRNGRGLLPYREPPRIFRTKAQAEQWRKARARRLVRGSGYVWARAVPIWLLQAEG
jgi:hypothetical protein